MARAIMGANIAAPGIATDGPHAGQQRVRQEYADWRSSAGGIR